MTQQRIIRHAEPSPGGAFIDVEVTNAYTDGRSRFDRVWVSRDELRGKTPSERAQAIFDALDDDLLEGVRDQPASAPAVTKDILETRMQALYADWKRWKDTRQEAQTRALPAAAVNALTNREDAAWGRYVTAIQAWRSAP